MITAPSTRRIAISLTALICTTFSACTNDEREVLTLEQMTQPTATRLSARAADLASGGAQQMQIGIRKTGRAGTMVREAQRAGFVTWISVDGASLHTRDGLLHATRGFGAGLMAVDQEQSRRRIFAHADGSTRRFHSYLTGNDQIVTRSYQCDIKDRGLRTLTIAGNNIATRLMAESCTNQDQQFLNLYWLQSTDNTLIQSRQWTGSFIGNLTTRLQVMP
ncbi:YjbF family lipoprotein [Phaeobacter sp. C3_T13_0]|uniref:YjbF family lipoprotein n=1 Tax=Phaeobacter cretensis TaxID=3342641 RepID=UPI0039BD84A1